MANIDSFVSWEMLRSQELSGHFSQVLQGWEALLAANTLTEPAYLTYLHDNAGFFLHDSLHQLISISEFEFEADLRADFVVCSDRASYGFEYEFIEIESPWDAVFTKKGSPSSNLTEAMNQIQRWCLWLDANRAEARRILPSKSFVVADQPAFKFTIIIGRRQDRDEWLHFRNQLAEQMNIEIRSFDYLTDRLTKRMFSDAPIICSSEFHRLPFETKNALANPFSTALKNSVWRKLVKSPNFSSAHIIANTATELLNAMSHSTGYVSYSNDWKMLPAEIREAIYAKAKLWA